MFLLALPGAYPRDTLLYAAGSKGNGVHIKGYSSDLGLYRSVPEHKGSK